MCELRRGGGMRDERVDDLTRMGFDAETARTWLASLDDALPSSDGQAGDEQPGDPLQIWPENWPAMRAWMRLQTQWHLAPDGSLIGLRYPEAEHQVQRLLRDASVEQVDQVMEHLQEMEQSALEALYVR